MNYWLKQYYLEELEQKLDAQFAGVIYRTKQDEQNIINRIFEHLHLVLKPKCYIQNLNVMADAAYNNEEGLIDGWEIKHVTLS